MAEPAAVPRPEACPRIADTPKALRPREKLHASGPGALTHVELLALILGSGTREDGALRLAAKLLRGESLESLAARPAGDWARTPGIGAARAARFAAAFELHRRLRCAAELDPPRVTTPVEACALVPEIRRARKEHLVGLYLDAQNRLIHKELLSVGSLNVTRTHAREILHPAIVHTALAYVLVHNHPSGSLIPSVDDVEFTGSVRRASELMGVELYDHIIVSERGSVSLRERGLL